MGKSQYIAPCMFCGQQTYVQVDDSFAKKEEFQKDPTLFEKYLTEMGTYECSCAQARAYTNVENRILNATERCKESADSPISDILISALRPVMMEQIDKLSISAGGIKYEVYLDSNEKLHVRRERKLVDDSTE